MMIKHSGGVFTVGLSSAGGRPRPLRHVRRRRRRAHACTRVLAGCRNTRSGGRRLASHTAIKAGILPSKEPSLHLPRPPLGFSASFHPSAPAASSRVSGDFTRNLELRVPALVLGVFPRGPSRGPRSGLCRYADVVAHWANRRRIPRPPVLSQGGLFFVGVQIRF